MPKLMTLIPTRAGYIYECVSCSETFPALTNGADEHTC